MDVQKLIEEYTGVRLSQQGCDIIQDICYCKTRNYKLNSALENLLDALKTKDKAAVSWAVDLAKKVLKDDDR